MNRKEFLSTLGLGAAFVLTSTCLGSCAKESLTPRTDVDFTLDLTAPANSNLLNNGGYIIQDRVVVAKTMTGEYVAATQICSHEDLSKIIFKNNEWFCTEHDARFGVNGNGLNSEASKGLATYQTELTGDVLRVFY